MYYQHHYQHHYQLVYISYHGLYITNIITRWLLEFLGNVSTNPKKPAQLTDVSAPHRPARTAASRSKESTP